MSHYEQPTCPGCGGKVLDWWDHWECLEERRRARYDEDDRDDYNRGADHEPR